MVKKTISGTAAGSRKPRIEYPCLWQYKVIGESKTEISRAVERHIGRLPHTLTLSNVSTGGRYVSINLEVTVHSEEQRLALYHLLAAQPAVKVVL